jgi:hypothetical protein
MNCDISRKACVVLSFTFSLQYICSLSLLTAC